MLNIHPLEQMPVLQVKLEFASSLAQLCEAAGSEKDILSQAIGLQIDQLLGILGIPGKTQVEMGVPKSSRMPGKQFFRVIVNGRRIHYPDELPKWVYAYSTQNLANSATDLPGILLWLQAIGQEGQEAPGYPLLVEFFSLTCLEAIRTQPESLLGFSQAEAYRTRLTPSQENELAGVVNWPPAAEWLLQVIKIVVNLGISLADIPKVSDILRETIGHSPEDAAEWLIAALRPDVLEVHLPEEYLRTLTLADPEKNATMFPFMRDGLFVELGLVYPRFRFVIDESLKPGCFALKINNLLRLPQIGLQPDQCLVNDTQERLKLNNSVKAVETRNPATQQPGSIAPIHAIGQLEKAELTTWKAFGYLILCIAAELRNNSRCFVDLHSVQKSLEQLQIAFPELVSSVRPLYAKEQITRLLRTLVSEQLSLRNLRLILERLLDYPYAPDDRTRYLVLDDRPNSIGSLEKIPAKNIDRLVAFVRAGLKSQISNKYARGTNTLVVYLIDVEIEQIVSKWNNEDLDGDGFDRSFSDEADKIIAAIRTEIKHLPPMAMAPAIWTTIEARPVLRRILQYELPRIPVIAGQETLPDLNIQPHARISLPA